MKVLTSILTVAALNAKIQELTQYVSSANAIQSKISKLKNAHKELNAIPIPTKATDKFVLTLMEAQDISKIGTDEMMSVKEENDLKIACDSFHEKVSDQYRQPTASTVKAQRLVEAVGCKNLDYRR